MNKKCGNFIFIATSIEGLYIIESKQYKDERGFFMETYKKSSFEEAGLDYDFVQDNQSASVRGVLRGLHFQKKFSQAKLVRVIQGEVYDVAVDLRKNSPTYGKWVGVMLSADNNKQFLIPRGFAHGFQVVSDYAEFTYKCDNLYHPEDEGGIMWNDPDLAIDWPVKDNIILSKKDKQNSLLRDLNFKF